MNINVKNLNVDIRLKTTISKSKFYLSIAIQQNFIIRIIDNISDMQDIQIRIQIAGERVNIPAGGVFNIEHEREGDSEEVEFQFKWKGKR